MTGLEPLLYVVATLGTLTVLFLFWRVWQANQEFHLKQHRSTEAGLADLLNYASVVDDGVIVGKNGSFMASWLYRGADNASATEQEREMVSFRLNQAFAGMGGGWMIHVDAVRRPAPGYSAANESHFPDAVSAAVDEERRRTFEGLGMLYEGFFIITVTWFPPILAEQRFVELMFDDDAAKPDKKKRTRDLIDNFKRELVNIENRMSSAVSMERLRANHILNEDGTQVTHDDFLQWLQFCVTGIIQPIQLPSNPSYIDQLVGGQELWTGVVPKIGRKFIQVVSIEGFPLESYPGVLTRLAEIPLEYRWSNRFIFLDTHEAVSHFEKFRKKWKQKTRGFFDQITNNNNGHIDEDAVKMVADAGAAIAETNSGMIRQGYYTSVIILMDEDRSVVENAALKLEKSIQNMGFGARTETINSMDAYLGSLPGHGVENIRRPLVNTMNLADLIPSSTIWTGDNFAPNPMMPNAPALMHGMTAGNSPFRINLDVRDLGHTAIFGPTRSGKSAHLGALALQWLRYNKAKVFAFDKGMAMYATCKGAKGSHFILGGATDKLAFAPLSGLTSPSRLIFAANWINDILTLNGVNTDPDQRNKIVETLRDMARTEAEDGKPGTISEFQGMIQDQNIRAALQDYTIDGLMGHLFDAETDGLELSNFVTFEIEQLMSLDKRFLLPALLYLFMRIEESLDGSPTFLILDEAWIFFDHPVFLGKIREWLKAFAKKNCRVALATQNLSDAAKSGILDVIIESTATKIFLPNVHALNPDATDLYTRMGLNLRQIDLIARAVPKRDYYLVSEKGRRMYSLALGPLALAFVGAGSLDDIKAIKDLEAIHGDDWIHAWLSKKNLRLSDYGVAA